MAIQLLGIAGSTIALNTFAFGIRCAGPFSAYALGLVIPKATKNSGLFSIITGTIGFVVWQLLPSVNAYLRPVVFGSLISVITFFVVNWIEWGKGVAPAPSAYLSDEEAAAIIAAEQQEM